MRSTWPQLPNLPGIGHFSCRCHLGQYCITCLALVSHHSHKHTLSLTTGTSKNVQLYHGIFYLSYRLKCHFGTVSPTLEVSFTLCFFLYDFFFISGLSPSLDSLLLWTFSLFDSSLLCIFHHKTHSLQLHVPTTPLANPTYNPHLDHN